MVAHGGDGAVYFGRGPRRFLLTSSDRLKPNVESYPIPKTAINRLAAEYMQDLRDGRSRRFIMSACSSDVEFAQDKVHLASISEAVAVRTAEATPTDIYGAGDVMFERAEENDEWVTFRGWREDAAEPGHGANQTNLLRAQRRPFGLPGWKIQRVQAVKIKL